MHNDGLANNCSCLRRNTATFYFADLFAFLQTTLGMILSFLAGRQSMKRNEKGRPSDKDCGLPVIKTD